jgi:hypothetical protein
VDFIVELSRKCVHATLHVVIGGDINLIRASNEKNNSNINKGLIDRFTIFIDLHPLHETTKISSVTTDEYSYRTEEYNVNSSVNR